jgi:hypothetical protein
MIFWGVGAAIVLVGRGVEFGMVVNERDDGSIVQEERLT